MSKIQMMVFASLVVMGTGGAVLAAPSATQSAELAVPMGGPKIETVEGKSGTKTTITNVNLSKTVIFNGNNGHSTTTTYDANGVQTSHTKYDSDGNEIK